MTHHRNTFTRRSAFSLNFNNTITYINIIHQERDVICRRCRSDMYCYVRLHICTFLLLYIYRCVRLATGVRSGTSWPTTRSSDQTPGSHPPLTMACPQKAPCPLIAGKHTHTSCPHMCEVSLQGPVAPSQSSLTTQTSLFVC